MKTLLTAFKGTHNSSLQIVQSSENDKLLLTNSYKGIEKDIAAFDFTPYDAVIMFGLDARIKEQIRIEPYAILDGDIRKTVLNVNVFSDVFKTNGLNTVMAKRATSYLCNYAYYHVLEIMNGYGMFIHIPTERYLTDEMKTACLRANVDIKRAKILFGLKFHLQQHRVASS